MQLDKNICIKVYELKKRLKLFLLYTWIFQVVLVVKNSPANAGDVRDVGLIPGSGKSPGVGNGNLLQYSCPKNSLDKGACWATVHGIPESDTTEQLSMNT